MAAAFIVFVSGIKRCERQGAMGSPFTPVEQVLVAASRKRNVDEMRDGCGVYYGNERTQGQPNNVVRTLACTCQFWYKFLYNLSYLRCFYQ